MNRVLHILGGMNVGGVETFLMNLYRVIDHERVQFDFLVNTKENAYQDEILSAGGRIFFLPPRNRGIWQYRLNLKYFFEKHREEFQVVQQHFSSLSSLEPLIMARRTGYPIRIAHCHSTAECGSRLHNILHQINKRRVGGIATDYLACSDLALNWAFGGTCVEGKAKVINNGIDIDRFRYNEARRREARRKLGIEDKLVIGHVGRFSAVKNHNFLLRIFRELQFSHPETRLLLVGTGELEPSIRKLTMQLDLGEKVIFTGVRSDTPDLLNAMDFFVFPSLYEGLPVALVEAQAAGLRIFCSDRVTLSANLTGNIEYLPLEESPALWAEKIRKSIGYSRQDTSELLIRAGYSIAHTADFLMKHYYCLSHA